MVELTGLWKRFGALVALRDLSVTVTKGSTLGLVGPNGSGKTTLLKLVATMSKPDTGGIRVDGMDALAVPSKVRRILGYMPAEFGCPEGLTILEYLDYFAALHLMSTTTRRQRIIDIMALTDLAGREDVVVRTLSTGNRQRLLLAKTLLHDPDLLLLDEPASGLDPRARAELRGILSELATMGKTIVISSHILADIESICTEVCILEQGRSVLQGGIKELENQRTATVGVFRIRVPTEAMDTAAKVLEGLSDVARCTRDGAELKVASHSTSGNALLGALIERDIEVLEMRRKETDLEDLFLESTEGITS